ncbi:MAG TPA: four helix bundle protein [Calditrichia bacterium]|nr:four helix bundle protein [Calditrichia bacterium]
MMQKAKQGFFRELKVYQNSLEAASKVFQLVEKFPRSEKYALVDQMKRASQSICANIAEAWRHRRYKRAFIAKLTICEAEATEMRVWLELSFRFRYLDNETFSNLDDQYDHIIAQLVTMIRHPDKWVIKPKEPEK